MSSGVGLSRFGKSRWPLPLFHYSPMTLALKNNLKSFRRNNKFTFAPPNLFSKAKNRGIKAPSNSYFSPFNPSIITSFFVFLIHFCTLLPFLPEFHPLLFPLLLCTVIHQPRLQNEDRRAAGRAPSQRHPVPRKSRTGHSIDWLIDLIRVYSTNFRFFDGLFLSNYRSDLSLELLRSSTDSSATPWNGAVSGEWQTTPVTAMESASAWNTLEVSFFLSNSHQIFPSPPPHSPNKLLLFFAFYYPFFFVFKFSGHCGSFMNVNCWCEGGWETASIHACFFPCSGGPFFCTRVRQFFVIFFSLKILSEWAEHTALVLWTESLRCFFVWFFRLFLQAVLFKILFFFMKETRICVRFEQRNWIKFDEKKNPFDFFHKKARICVRFEQRNWIKFDEKKKPLDFFHKKARICVRFEQRNWIKFDEKKNPLDFFHKKARICVRFEQRNWIKFDEKKNPLDFFHKKHGFVWGLSKGIE